MKIRTSELTGIALNWAVAKCEEINPTIVDVCGVIFISTSTDMIYRPSISWLQGGPIIERLLRAGFELRAIRGEDTHIACSNYTDEGLPHGSWHDRHIFEIDDTPLVAAMRAYVASKMGNEVDVLDELIEPEQEVL